ncbi:SH3 domain protein [Necator americanus]|uniref:SH3 domain protein n=1 Tax=Necator americanus TaxID=51031 RepID=W2SXB3_NECAM|nr:SH3 domain protein [Necator americanus]ETN74394.1 SH3 domain protein [Necator americanus]
MTMMLDENGGGMAGNDLRTLIESRIPEHRSHLETSHVNLENVAAYCEGNYLNAHDRNSAFDETKQFALQSLASVAYQINTLARDLLDMLDLQTDKISSLTGQIDNIDVVVNIHKEKLARREIGALTTNKSVQKQPKIIAPAVQEPPQRYKRTPIDFSVLDGIGHGVRCEVPLQHRGGLISRAASSVSSSQPYSVHYSQYERTANIGTNTLGRSSVRSGHLSMTPSDHYRVPLVMPLMDHQRYMSVTTPQSHSVGEYGAHQIGYRSAPDSDTASDFGRMSMQDRYGTLRLHQAQIPRASVIDGTSVVGEERAESPGFPLPPPQLSSHYGYVGMTRADDLPPPAIQMLNSTHEDEPLPPPPLSQANFFDTHTDWIPRNYIEKAVALYDYDADKPDELSLRENCIVYVLRKNEDGWFEGVLDGVTGLFPGNYVQPV